MIKNSKVNIAGIIRITLGFHFSEFFAPVVLNKKLKLYEKNNLRNRFRFFSANRRIMFAFLLILACFVITSCKKTNLESYGNDKSFYQHYSVSFSNNNNTMAYALFTENEQAK